jgi:hypothetical protein
MGDEYCAALSVYLTHRASRGKIFYSVGRWQSSLLVSFGGDRVGVTMNDPCSTQLCISNTEGPDKLSIQHTQ